MPRKKPEGWTPKRPAPVTACMTCSHIVYCNTHVCPHCGVQTYAGYQAEMRKHLKGR